MSRWRVYGAFAGLFVLGALTGRMTVPAKVVSVDRLVEVERAAKAQVATAQAETTKAKKANVRWMTKTEYLPGGTITVTKTVIKEVERQERATTATAAASTETREAAKTVVRERIVERDTRPKWSIAGRAGMGLDLKPRYQGEIGRRIWGGLWLTGGADISQRTALVGLRMEF